MDSRNAISIAIFLAAVFVSRLIVERGMKALSVEQKGTLVENLAPFRKYGIGVVIIMAFVAYAAKAYGWLAVGLIAYVVLSQGWTLWHAKRLQLPAEYIRASAVSSAIVIVGVLLFFGMAYGYV